MTIKTGERHVVPRPRTLACLSLAISMLLACASAPPIVNRYDFGIPPTPAPETALASSHPADVTVLAPAWLDTTAVLYRLSYADGSQLHTYAQTAWVSPPARLVEQAFKSAPAAPAQAACADSSRTEQDPTAGGTRLSVDLLEFSQDFDAPQSSHVALRARVRLLAQRSRAVLAQRDFDLRGAVPTPDGPGAVHGLRDLSAGFARQALEWAGHQLPQTCAPGADAGAAAQAPAAR